LLAKGAEGHRAKRSCFACHNQAPPMIAFTTARDRGFTLTGVDIGQMEHTRGVRRQPRELPKGARAGGRRPVTPC
jgi:hypothetical protein